MSLDPQIVRSVIDLRGARWVAPALLQPAGLYLELVGEALRHRAFLIEGGDDLCLRPDMTAPVVRDALSRALPPEGERLAYDGLVFRRGLGRGEQRQIGMEHIAPAQTLAAGERDVLAAAVEAAGGGQDVLVRAGDVALVGALADALGWPAPWRDRLVAAFARPGGVASILADAGAEPRPAPALAAAIAHLDEAHAAATVEAVLAERGLSAIGGRRPQDIARRLSEKARADAHRPNPEDIARLSVALAVEAPPEKAFATLSKLGKGPLAAAIDAARDRFVGLSGARLAFSPGFGRGLAYYDGFVFEIEAAGASIGGGGRYDRLLAALGGPQGWGAAGFALTFDRPTAEDAP
jgi:ATP phosphoribosyltransferase regulatory subunit